MTPSQAAQRLKYSKQHVCLLIRQGKLRAPKVRIPGGFYWDITEEELQRFLSLPPPLKGRQKKTA